jgi:hypothetical protein
VVASLKHATVRKEWITDEYIGLWTGTAAMICKHYSTEFLPGRETRDINAAAPGIPKGTTPSRVHTQRHKQKPNTRRYNAIKPDSFIGSNSPLLSVSKWGKYFDKHRT